MGVELRLGRWAINNGSTGFLGQIQVAGYEVSMEVCLQYILNLRTISFCLVDIRLHIPQRINDDRFSLALNIVSCFCQTAGVQLLYFHG